MLDQYSIFKITYLFRMLAACDFSYSVERVNIWQCLGAHSEMQHNPLASAGHPGHHLGILDSDAGSGDLRHSRLVPLPASVGAENNTTSGLKSQRCDFYIINIVTIYISGQRFRILKLFLM